MKKRLALISLAALCFSCSPPPFDLNLLRTANLAGKMTKEAAVGSSLPMDGSMGWEAVFLPVAIQNGVNAGVDCGRGFIRIWTYEGSAIFFTYPGTAGYETFDLKQYLPPPNAEPFMAGTQVIPLKTGDYLGVFVNIPGAFASSGAIVFAADVPNKVFTNLTPVAFPSYLGPLGVLGTDRVLGIAFPPSPDPLLGTCYILSSCGSPDTYVEARAPLDKNGPGAPIAIRLNPMGTLPFLDGVPRCQYFFDEESGTGIACIRSDKTWRTYTWSPARRDLPGITARVDALLSTGELFSTEDGIARLFSMEGNGGELARFPLFNLTYSGESFSNGVARMYFTQSFVAEYRLGFYVYSIPTADLKTLDEP